MSAHKYKINKQPHIDLIKPLNTQTTDTKQWTNRLNNLTRTAQQSTVKTQQQHTQHSTDYSPTSSISQQHISIVKRKEKLVTAVNDWKPYTGIKRSETIAPVYESEPPYSQHHTRNSVSELKRNPSFSQHIVSTSKPSHSIQHSFSMIHNDTEIQLTRWQRYKQLHTVYSNYIQQYMQSKPYIIIFLFLTLVSLYGKDFNDAVLPPSCDTPTAIVLCIIFALFSLEIIINCITRINYIFSFYIALDILGTFSLIFDIYFILNLFWNVDTLNNTVASNSSTHVNQSASILQVTKFSRVLRILRLIRIVRIFKFYSTQQHSSVNASKVGLHLSELIDRRVILVLLGLLIVCPFLSVTIPNDTSAAYGLVVIEQTTNLQDQQQLVTNYLNLQNECIYLNINGNTYYNTLAQNTYLRQYETVVYSTATSQAIYSTRAETVLSAIFNISLTTFIILIFGIGIVIVSRDVRELVVAPLERMTHMIKKLAGTICVLNSDNSNQSMDNTATLQQLDTSDTTLHQQSKHETNMIEAVIEKMALIFAVQPEASIGGSDSKAMQIMAGSKHTEIVTGNSVVSIQVVERPRTNSFDFDDNISEDTIGNIVVVDLERYTELQSIEQIIQNPTALHYYRMYMISNLQLENLLFYEEVQRFQSIISLHTNHLWTHFISPRATTTAINIPSTLRDSIYQSLCTQYRSSIFDDAQAQVLALMNGHWRTFIDSKYCQAYIQQRYQQLVARGKIKEINTTYVA